VSADAAIDGTAAILAEWYAGEVGGEALFWHLGEAGAPTAARKWLALAAVEARVAEHLLHLLVTASLPVPPTAAALSCARSRAAALAARAWPEQMLWLERLARAALESMRREAATLPPRFAAVGALVVRHEVALLEFARRERAGAVTDTPDPIEAFLATTARP